MAASTRPPLYYCTPLAAAGATSESTAAPGPPPTYQACLSRQRPAASAAAPGRAARESGGLGEPVGESGQPAPGPMARCRAPRGRSLGAVSLSGPAASGPPAPGPPVPGPARPKSRTGEPRAGPVVAGAAGLRCGPAGRVSCGEEADSESARPAGSVRPAIGRAHGPPPASSPSSRRRGLLRITGPQRAHGASRSRSRTHGATLTGFVAHDASQRPHLHAQRQTRPPAFKCFPPTPPP